ncbi:MAG: hypothetical protein V4527_06790 [Pseudomonadota bacterium]
MNATVVMGLVKRRALLTHEIEETHQRLRQMVVDLENLDATLLQFDPNLAVETIKPRAFRPPENWSKRGEMMRLIVSVLRRATEPLTSRDIAFELIVERALDKTDQKLIRLMSKRVGVALRHQRDAGRVVSILGPGQYNLWQIARNPADTDDGNVASFPPKRGFASGVRQPLVRT